MPIVFVNRFFFPDHSATAQHLTDLAWHLARHGASVSVITSRQRIDYPTAGLPAHERCRGVQVHRVWSTGFGRHGLPGRAMDYLSFYVMATVALLATLRRGDVVVACTDPPLICIVVGWAAAVRGARCVNWLHDLFPEVAEHLAVLPRSLAAGLRRLRDRSLRSARCNVVIGELMARRLLQRGVDARGITVIHNWCDPTAVVPTPREENPLLHDWALDGSFVVGYSGNLGRAHEFEGVLAAAVELRDDERIVFLFIGAGAQAGALRARAQALGLRNMRFLPSQPRRLLRHSLGVADLHLVSLRPALEGFIVPSKFYGIAAAGRPCLVLGDREGEIAGIVRHARCGLVCDGNDGVAIAQAIRALAASPQRCQEMGHRARSIFEERYAMPLALARWQEVLDLA